MDRRDSLKALAVGTLSAGTLLTSCNGKAGEKNTTTYEPEEFGRTQEEKEHDAKLMSEKYFSDAELAAITILCDIIIPADGRSGSASEAKVPEFIEFMVKDQPRLQTPLRGGIRWLDMKSLKLNDKSFANASKAQQLELVDLIAFPEDALPENTQGVSFFNQMRNLTATGFFTSKMGIEDLDYKGNTPNAWDGVPDDVLKQYGLEYDEKTLAQCLKNDERGKIMTWES
ncbi:gluconate 2-dehydrogenase subunit 3 family protein [soil metagenome]